jgi:hypothetical protein
MGVDDSVAPEDLANISQKYPFVEWGLNLSSNYDRIQSPSYEWIDELLFYSDKIRLRGVLRGRWERDILAGNLSLKIEKPSIWESINRIQVDIRKGHYNLIESLQLIPNKEVILQANHPQSIIIGSKLNAYLLLPKDELFTFPGYCGYSLTDKDIDLVFGYPDIFWISVDGFRGEDGITMDLLQVEELLDRVEDHVTGDSWIKALLQTSSAQKRFSEHP